MINGKGTINDIYFEWLYGQIASVRNRNPARAYWKMAKDLYKKPFYGYVQNDVNREEDGKQLRYEFLDETEYDDAPPHDWMTEDCSTLEMLIALSRRASFQTDIPAIEWFWKMMENVGLRGYTDLHYNVDAANYINETLDRIVNRTYEANGDGGLFPLRNARNDQRKVELWYQLSAYILEEGYIDIGA